MTETPILESELTCPECGHKSIEAMPENACVRFYDCPKCKAIVGTLSGDCCVFCSHGSVPCPPVQVDGKGCCS